MTAFLKPALLALLLWQLPAPSLTPKLNPAHLRYQRLLDLPRSASHSATQACAPLDAPVFAHAAPSLKDLRLFNGTAELPFATTRSEPLQQESDDARILNLTLRHRSLAFDLDMPHRPYTGLSLSLNRQNFLATATVSGETAPAPAVSTRIALGTFPLFDLTAQHLGRDTSIPLPESTFPYLHIELTLTPAANTPGTTAAPPLSTRLLQGATVPPNREAQTLYTTALQSSTFLQRGHQTIATFTLPIHVPIERISFVLAPGFNASFSRTVQITAQANPADPAADPSPLPAPQPEISSATILRVHTAPSSHLAYPITYPPTYLQAPSANSPIPPIHHEQLSIPIAIGSNMQRPATLQVAIDNGDDPPLPLAAVRLEMRQRNICFDPAAVTQRLTLDYGDPDADYGDPDADYGDPDAGTPESSNSAAPGTSGSGSDNPFSSALHPIPHPLTAALEPERLNPAFHPSAASRPLPVRPPERLWIILLGVLALLATFALRLARNLLR